MKIYLDKSISIHYFKNKNYKINLISFCKYQGDEKLSKNNEKLNNKIILLI